MAGFTTGLAAAAFAARSGRAGLRAPLRGAAAVLRDDIDVVSFLHDLILAQLEAPVGDAFAGLHVVLVAVPGTDEVQLFFGEIEPARGLVGHEALFNLS